MSVAPSQIDFSEDLAALATDPLGFVMWAFPWGEIGGELEHARGPEKWQRECLERIGRGLSDDPFKAIRHAVASGHGIGKSALVSWLILWAMSTFPDCRGVVTANTETQLKTKTWVELNKWFRRLICRDMFNITATRLSSRDPEHAETWRVDMVPWSEHNPEAFAGMQNQGKRILFVFDEASKIDDSIWETTSGALIGKNTEIIWCAFGNPTRNTGRFREIFNPAFPQYQRWTRQQIDSRTVSISNKEEAQEWIDDWGLTSDYVKVRVLGQFPSVGIDEFISIDLAQSACWREAPDAEGAPLIMGVDVARFGDNKSVIWFRKGLDAKSIEPVMLHGASTVALTARILDEYAKHHPDAIFIDEGGVGGGVVDQCRHARLHVIGINFGSKPDRAVPYGEARYANKRSEMWGAMRDWLATGACAGGNDMVQELIAPLYSFREVDQSIQLESKKEMKARGVASPDMADALALTFAYPVAASYRRIGQEVLAVEQEYDPFAMEAA